ncbi:MAG: serine hydrolase [Emcibacteraceae bacterium]|nr:serine hydrolase [Emcibacteraceae bacterium]
MINKIFQYFLISILFTSITWAQETVAVDKEMRETLERIINESDIPGLSIAIANEQGLLWSGTAGYSNIEERSSVSQRHLFGIGDLSNHFIGAAVLNLIEDGMLDLNATVESILRDSLSNIESANSATISQLLNHTSGISSYDQNNDWVRRARGIQLNPTYHWKKNEPLKYVTGSSRIITTLANGQYNYSKSNYTILGLIIEKISGGMLEDELISRVLKPLNLKETYLDGFQLPPFGSLVGSYHLGSNFFIERVGINAHFDFVDDSRLINTSGTSLSSEGAAAGILTTAREFALFQIGMRAGTIFNTNKLNLLNHEMNHSEILGFTSDMVWLEKEGIIIVVLANLGVANTGQNPARTYLSTYVQKNILPIAKKYAK